MPSESPASVPLPLSVDLLDLEPAVLRRLCEHAERFSAALLFRTAWMHLAERIRAGLQPPPRWNLRSSWYRWGRPLAEHTEIESDSAYAIFTSALAELVLERRKVDYALFDMTDDNWEFRRVGRASPSVILFCEKAGHFRLLRRIHADFDVTVQALRGQPKAVTSEYLVRHSQSALAEGAAVRLVGLVDYDPAGATIARSFQRQLGQLGLAVESSTSVFGPGLFSAQELETLSHEPSVAGRSASTKARRWLEATGGIGGQLRGISVGVLPPQRLESAVREAIVRALGPP